MSMDEAMQSIKFLERQVARLSDERHILKIEKTASESEAARLRGEARKWQQAALEAGRWREVERSRAEAAEKALAEWRESGPSLAQRDLEVNTLTATLAARDRELAECQRIRKDREEHLIQMAEHGDRYRAEVSRLKRELEGKQ